MREDEEGGGVLLVEEGEVWRWLAGREEDEAARPGHSTLPSLSLSLSSECKTSSQPTSSARPQATLGNTLVLYGAQNYILNLEL